MAWFSNRTPQEKADDFDLIDGIVTDQAKAKQLKGEFPYDVDAAIRDAGKVVEPKRERRKGKHRK